MKKQLLVGLLLLAVFTLSIAGCARVVYVLNTEDVDLEAEVVAAEEGIGFDEARNIVGQAYVRGKRVIWTSCTDSDGGKNYETFGRVTATYTYRGRSGTKVFSDVCKKWDTLHEYYCTDVRPSYEKYWCQTGCSNGACVNKTETGTIDADTTPTGANFYIDDSYKGTTPKIVSGVKTGTRKVDFKLAGYEDYTTYVEVYKDQTTTVRATLRKIEEQTGTIDAKTTPSGASFYIDGAYQGTTPKVVSGVQVGTRKVEFRLTGYETHIEYVEVYAGQTSYVDVILTKIEETGTIDAKTTPSGASFYIDGAYQGTTPKVVSGVQVGTRKVDFKLAGYEDYTTYVDVYAGQTSYVNVTLKRIEQGNQSQYPVHNNIWTTIFWACEQASPENGWITNEVTAWDECWCAHFGCEDTRNCRKPGKYEPCGCVPGHNPFYFALPFNDFGNRGRKSDEDLKVIYWFKPPQPPDEDESLLKGHWIKVMYGGKAGYAQWVDVGPWNENDGNYVFGTSAPKAKEGLDVSPAMETYLGLSGYDQTSWQFIDYKDVPPGPWKDYPLLNNVTCWKPECHDC